MIECEKCGSKALTLDIKYNVETQSYEERIICNECHHITGWYPMGRLFRVEPVKWNPQ